MDRRDYDREYYQRRKREDPSYVYKKRAGTRAWWERQQRAISEARAKLAPEGSWPLLEEFRAARDKRAVIRRALEVWRNAL